MILYHRSSLTAFILLVSMTLFALFFFRSIDSASALTPSPRMCVQMQRLCAWRGLLGRRQCDQIRAVCPGTTSSSSVSSLSSAPASSAASSSAASTAPAGSCKVAGCSGQLCVDENADGISTCEWREEYACYRTATCERQASGECGWTQTSSLQECLANPGGTVQPAGGR